MALEVGEAGWHDRAVFGWVGGKPRFPQGSWGGPAAQMDSARRARGLARALIPAPVNY